MTGLATPTDRVGRRVAGRPVFHVVRIGGADLVSLCGRARGPRSTWLLSPRGECPTCAECVRIRAEQTRQAIREVNERRAAGRDGTRFAEMACWGSD